MPYTPLKCPNCNADLPEEMAGQADFSPCPACTTPLWINAFPALYREMTVGKPGEAIMIEGESSCFFHPQKKAVQACDGCGRFVCALCDCPLDGRHYCPTCLESGQKKGKIQSLENQRTLYGNIALTLAIVPLLIFYFTFFTAPAALYIAIRHWKSPLSIVRPTHGYHLWAIGLASLQVVGWLVVFILIFTGHKSHG